MERVQLDLAVPYAAPSGPNEERVAKLWSEVLNISPIGMDDDFFDLGGDSLAAENFATAFEEAFDVNLKPGQIARWNTPRKIARLLDQDRQQAPLPGNLVAVNPEAEREAIFVIHGRAGTTILRPQFIAGLHADQPLYLFEAQGYDGEAEPLDRVEDIASDYLSSMLAVRPEGPWHLLSFCAGGWIAVEIVCQMMEKGLEPSSVTLLDVNLKVANLNLVEWKKQRNKSVGRSPIPVLSDSYAHIGKAASAVSQRLRMFAETGDFAAFSVDGIRKDPSLAEQYRRAVDEKYDRKIVELTPDVTEESSEDEPREQLMNLYSSEAARRTASILAIAFQTYKPKHCTYPVTLIMSERRSKFMDRSDHPLMQILPNSKVVVVRGQNHRDTVSSNETARMVQKLVDDASADADRSVDAGSHAIPAGGETRPNQDDSRG